jgi:EAL domain-containing protein (putative c-di-GMP-specific phosphodiesterase class I)
VNVNLSIVQLLQNNIVSVIEHTMELTGINPKNLTLEITEGLAIHDLARICGTLEEIRSLGCRIALDDFGTGYSSLNHLKELPLDVIKIDKCFINDVGRDQFSDAFIKTVSDLADTIDVNVVVEGVEEPRQEKALDHMKIDMIQGYLYDRPLCKEDFERKYLK